MNEPLNPTDLRQGVAKVSSILFARITQLAAKKGVCPIKDTTWSYDIGSFKLFINGTEKRVIAHYPNCMKLQAPPYTIIFWFKGVYVGYANATHIVLLEEKKEKTGEKFNVDTLTKIVEDEIEKC